jgi:hypothetical protein
MNELTQLALEVQSFCVEKGWFFCFIGGLAVQHWGEPRMTQDVDLTLFTGFSGEEVFIDTLLSRFEGRIPGARDFALQHRVLLLKNHAGIGLDIALGALPFEASAISRARDIELEAGAWVRLCSTEDLIVMKAFAGRPLDWNDVSTIVTRQGSSALDWLYIFEHLTPLAELKQSPETLSRLRGIQCR